MKLNHNHEWSLPGQAGVCSSCRLESFSHLFCLAGSQRHPSLRSNTAGKVCSILVRVQLELAGGPVRGHRFHRDDLHSARRMQHARSGDCVSGRPQMMSIMSPGIGHHLGNGPSDSTSRKLLQRIISAGRALCKAIHSSLLCHGVVPMSQAFLLAMQRQPA